MKTRAYIPDRYNNRKSRKKYRYFNTYKIFNDHIELLIKDKISKKTVLKCLLEKNVLTRISKYHWGSTGRRPPCTHVECKQVTIGQFIGDPNFRNFGKVKGKSVFDFRRGKHTKTGNNYYEIDNKTMKLKIDKRYSKPYYVIFDKEDYKYLQNHIWRVERDSMNIYNVMANVKNKVVFMHRYLLKAHGEVPGNKGFRKIRPQNYVFDLRKSVIYSKLLNIFKSINSNIFELIINSVHGFIHILIDKEDFKRVSKLSWAYKRNRKIWVINNYKGGSLKRFILGKKGEKYRYLKVKKDKLGRFHYRKRTLLKGLY